jgi:DNA primase
MTENTNKMDQNPNTSSTTVEEIEFENLDDLLGIPSASSVISPVDKKQTVLKSNKVDISFLDEIDDDDTDIFEDDKELALKTVSAIVDTKLDDDVIQPPKAQNNTETSSAMLKAADRLVKKGVLQLFDDGKNVNDYTAEDFEELIEANISSHVGYAAENAPVEIFSQLPEEVQAVIHYALNGGHDMKSLFGQLAKTQETFDLNVENEEDQETIARQYLNATDFGTLEEIEDEINELKDRGTLAKYAERYKPKLDAKQAEVIEKRLKTQQAAQDRKVQMEKNYQDVVYNTLNTNNLNGIPLNNKIQTMLYYGLTDSSKYQDAKGNPTNALGFLLEQHQFGAKANPSLVAEALWLLADPEHYRNSIKQLGANQANSNTVRQLRTEEQSRNSSSSGIGDINTSANRNAGKRKPLEKSSRSLFSR